MTTSDAMPAARNAFPVVPAASRLPALAIAVLLGAGAIAVVLAGIPSDFYDLDRHAVPKETLLHATALLTGLIVARRARTVSLGVIDILLLLFTAWTLVTTLGAANPWLAMRSAAMTVSALILYWAARFAAKDGYRPMLAGLLGLAIAIGAVTGLAQAYGRDIGVLAESRAPGGTFGNRNFLAHLMAIGIPLFVSGTVAASRRLARLAAYGGLALATMALVLTRSRAAWLGAAAGLAAFGVALALRPRPEHPGAEEKRRRFRGPGLVAAAAVLAALAIPNRLSWRSDTPYLDSLRGVVNYREGSGRGRVIQYRNSIEMARDHIILGVGPGNWMVHYPRVTTAGDPSFAGADPIPTNPWPSSDWLAVLTERGAPAVLLALGAGLAIALTALRRVAGGTEPWTSAVLVAVLAATFVVGLFDAVLLLPIPAFMVSVLAGLFVPDTTPIIARPLSPRGPRALVAAVGLIGILITTRSALSWAAIAASGPGRTAGGATEGLRYDPHSYRLHLFLGARGRCATRLPHARQAARLLPYHPAPRRLLAACGERAGSNRR